MKLLLPLKFYDAAGRIIPSVGFYFCLIYISRSILIFIASLSGRESSDTMLRLFYPDNHQLYTSLSMALPAVVVLVIVGFREKIWSSSNRWFFGLIRPLIVISILGDLVLRFILAKQNHWQFSWVISFTFLVSFLCLYYIAQSQHTKLMVADWRKG